MVDYVKRPKPDAGGAPAAGSGGVSLSKVTLTKASPTVSLAKGSGGRMRVNLSWNARPSQPAQQQSGGFFKRLAAAAQGAGGGGIDLDLGALFELQDGRKGVVQALGNSFGALEQPPYDHLDGDDRAGGGGENLTVNLDKLSEIKRILVFAYIYSGVPAWDQADGVVTLFPQGSAPVEIRLDEHSGSRMCALALLENTGGTLQVRREVRYVDGAQDKLDAAYGWGMDWTPGRK